MRKFSVTSLIAVVLLGASRSQAQESPQLPKPDKEHAWLQQLVGEWEAEVEAIPGPDQPAVKSKGTETVRAIGGFWIVAENKGDAGGQPFTGLLTLGYDSQKKQYVGTWIDSMTDHLWTYQGEVDKSGKRLTLNTEGPCHAGLKTTCRFREVIELKSNDHKVFTSSIEVEDGKWTTMMTINYRRKK